MSFVISVDQRWCRIQCRRRIFFLNSWDDTSHQIRNTELWSREFGKWEKLHTLILIGIFLDSSEAQGHLKSTKRLVNGPYWNLNCFDRCSLSVGTECFGLLINDSVSSLRFGGEEGQGSQAAWDGVYDKMHVFDKVPIAQYWERTGKAPLKARWVDIDKGTRCRSRWVAKQFKGSGSEEWFAATPPIEALRALISHTMSSPKKKKNWWCATSLELSCTLQCNMRDTWSCVRRRRSQSRITTCVQSYAWACMGPRSPLKIGKILNRQGFTRSVLSSPEKFEMSCARRRLRCVGGTSGSGLDSKRVGVESGNQYYNTGRSKEVKILNRKLCWHDGVGISYEADSKHAEAIIRETGAHNLTSLKI